jgi:hypothetical protein
MSKDYPDLRVTGRDRALAVRTVQEPGTRSWLTTIVDISGNGEFRGRTVGKFRIDFDSQRSITEEVTEAIRSEMHKAAKNGHIA